MWVMYKRPTLILGANGQDGFITTAICCDVGMDVVAASRLPDSRLRRLAAKYPNLTLLEDETYLSKPHLTKLFTATLPGHCFYFASQHGPAGSMKPTIENLDASKFLNITTPQLLCELALQVGCSLTLPSSSRIYSGYLDGASEDILINFDSRPFPSDYYGQDKLAMMEIAEISRTRGAVIHTPVLFNHDSMFKRDGYVSWAVARFMTAVIAGGETVSLRNPLARVDLSNAVDVCRKLVAAAGDTNRTTLEGSGGSKFLAELALEGAGAMDLPVSLAAELRERMRSALFVRGGEPTNTLVAACESAEVGVEMAGVGNSLALMSYSLDSSSSFWSSSALGFLEHLPKSIASFGSRDIHQFSSING